MTRFLQFLLLTLAPICALVFAAGANSFAQTSRSPDTSRSRVVLTKLSGPVYPQLAKRTKISGDVTLSLGIGQNGSVESVVVISGHPLLQQAALESAQHSQFECRGCTELTTTYSLVYTFQLVARHCPAPASLPSGASQQEDEKPRSRLSQAQNHVTLVDVGGFCEGVFERQVRSAKCLYLWRCGWRM